ncbi:sulfurtransferase [Bordetella sp. 15P40C-2]|uniref:sulfurtransferase n=1 Tax=Bordetella sp. 15P40C-2 TaxID=2572246 RepID=UPI0013277ACD|nr:sulfurtransferase [Bordetella sp. 15P40C-2]MVW70254.1 sulfurtransferase [Bordetella sp. 15P40C-2]
MSNVVNIAAYKFVPLDELPVLRAEMLARAQAAELKGTILLAEEGINLFLAGTATGIESWLQWLQSDPRFAELEVKYSFSDHVPFRKMLVKIKREIIRMNHPAIQPRAGRAPAVAPTTLARWLEQGQDDEGRPIVMLDTRNAFEVDEGTFEGAIDWRIDRFTQFPEAVLANRGSLEGKTVVSFCTGGIRCEKAAIFMAEAGIDHVYQLDGGILKYFEETGGRGFKGNCFVFDERVALDPSLAPTAEPGEASQ